jgi:ABC-type glutathione transport system ATPase component
LGGTLMESLREAQILAEGEYRLSQARQRGLADQLKQDLILTHFYVPADDDFPRYETPGAEDIAALAKLKAPITQSLTAINVETKELKDVVGRFFDTLVDVAGRVSGPSFDKRIEAGDKDAIVTLRRWFALQPQVGRIKMVNAHVTKYNAAAEKIAKPIQRYLELVNTFLSDSKKALNFSPTGDLQVAIQGKGAGRPITALSSGERQLVVILTHLVFNEAARQANVLIIDEPELSLHLHWQEKFVDALQNASKGLQLILATHSPSIIMERDANCVDVMGAHR